MGKTLLVDGVDLEKGAEILRILDGAGLKISVALWVYLPEYEDWRLVLSSRKFDSVRLPKAYGLLHDALDAAGLSLEKNTTGHDNGFERSIHSQSPTNFWKSQERRWDALWWPNIRRSFCGRRLRLSSLVKARKLHSNLQASSNSSRGLRGKSFETSP